MEKGKEMEITGIGGLARIKSFLKTQNEILLMPRPKRLSVADFFCGAGGFSEGFRQAGFDVVFALDSWGPAIATHTFNHPDCEHFKGDILSIEPNKIDETIPDTDVIVGSPPCVVFSNSNKSGKADKELGVKLIMKYLQIVAIKKNKNGSKLKFWALENVPNSGRYIKGRYTFAELNLPGGDRIALEVPMRGVFNAADYGAPQTRKRYLCGDFPNPIKTNTGPDEWIPMNRVLSELESPSIKPKGKIKDPNFGFSIDRTYLIDHNYDTTIEKFEWEQAKRLKEDHGYMGRMSFPEDTSRPSRTIMATQSAVSRESLILESDKRGKYRLPTIREIACFMSFPITYQFISNSEISKYRLVGNAVCVKLSNSIAKSMADRLHAKLKADPNPHPDLEEMLNSMQSRLDGRIYKRRLPRERRFNAKFRMHVPYLKERSFRVDLDNKTSKFDSGIYIWSASLHRGTGKRAKKRTTDSMTIRSIFNGDERFKSYGRDLVDFVSRIPRDPKLFHDIYRRAPGVEGIGPEDALQGIKSLIDKNYPENEFMDRTISPAGAIRIGTKEIPVRVLAAFYACQLLSERLSGMN